MATAPPVPSRRKVPPPPPSRHETTSSKAPAAAGRAVPPSPARSASSIEHAKISIINESISEPALGGIAARIAALKLNQVSGGKPLGGDSSPAALKPQTEQRTLAAKPSVSSSGNLNKAIKRAPPPPPKKQASSASHQDITLHVSQEDLAPVLPAPVLNKLETPAPALPTLPPRKVPPLLARRATQAIPRRASPEPEPELEPTPVPSLPARRLPPPPAPRSPSPELVAPTPPPINRASRPSIPLATKPSFAPVDVEAPQSEYESEYGADSGYGSAEPEEASVVEAAPEAAEEDSCLKCRSFELVDAHAAAFPREYVESLEQLAFDLTAPFESATDKARALFTWLHHNIEYDAYSFLNHCVQPATPEDTLRRGLAVCDGYAGLFAQLAELAGLQAAKVTGHGKGWGFAALDGGAPPPYTGNHAWNAVVLDDGAWHLVDACWGAGVLDAEGVYNKRLAEIWFTSTNEEFGRRHFPENEGWQLREDGVVITWEEYILAPPRPQAMGTLEQLHFDEGLLWPNDKVIAGGYEHTFHVRKACWHMERRDYYTDYVLMLLIDVGGQKSKEVVFRAENYGGWTRQQYIPPGEGTVQLAVVNAWDNMDGRGVNPYDVQAWLGAKGMSLQMLARWEVAQEVSG